MRPSPPHSYRCSHSETVAFWKSRLLFLAMGVSVTAIVLFRDGNYKAYAQEQKVSPPDRTGPSAQPPTHQAQQVVWVNAQTGNDAKADGSEQAPFRTLTRALEFAQPNTVIQLAAGTYSTDTGEVFPIVLKPGVTVQGNPDELGHGIVIRGGGSYSSATLGRQNVALVGVRQATLAGVTITNPTVRGHGLWVETGNLTIRDNTFISSTNAGAVVTGSSTPLVQNNLFVLNRTNGLWIAGYAQPEVSENIFQRTGAGITISDSAAPQINRNRISQNRDGIIVEGNAHPILRDNTLEDSERDGLVVIAQSQPNLGTGREPGNNRFLNNRRHDINASATDQTLPAFGNQLASNRMTGKVDLSGNTPLTSLTTVASASEHLPATQVVHSRQAAVRRAAPSVATSQATSRSQASGGQTSGAQTSGTQTSGSQISSQPAPPLISSLPPSTRTASSPTGNPTSSPASRPTAIQPTVARVSETAPPRVAPATPPRTESISRQSVEIPVPAPADKTAQLPPRPVQSAVSIPVPPPERSTPSASLVAFRPPARPSAGTTARTVAMLPPSGHSQPSSRLGSAPSLSSVPSSGSSSGLTGSGATSAGPAARAVNIPVPLPESPLAVPRIGAVPEAVPQFASVTVAAAASLPRQLLATSAPTLSGSPITIPVPPPERGSASAPANPSSTAASTTAANTRVLPVPSAEIPLGNTGDMPRVSVADSGGMLLASRPSSLQYRVLVETSDEAAQSLVRSLVPDAFSTSVNGQSLMQIGAFSTQGNAQEAVEMLSRNGLRCIIQAME